MMLHIRHTFIMLVLMADPGHAQECDDLSAAMEITLISRDLTEHSFHLSLTDIILNEGGLCSSSLAASGKAERVAMLSKRHHDEKHTYWRQCFHDGEAMVEKHIKQLKEKNLYGGRRWLSLAEELKFTHSQNCQ